MRETDSILSIHVTQTMSAACANARAAAQQLLGRCTVHVLDSMTASLGLGFLVELAAQQVDSAASLDDLARIVRKQTARVYSMFYTETLDYLQRSGLLSESHTTLGEMLGIKPLVTIEDGQLVATEKVRTRVQAVDKLIEFVGEFDPATDRLVIVHHSAGPHASLGEPARTLQNRLTNELHWPTVPTVPYNPSLGTFLGPDATGVVIYQDPKASAIDAFASEFDT
jgi:DegV family protein with EDD domain